MTREEAHKLVDSIFDIENSVDTTPVVTEITFAKPVEETTEEVKKELPEGQRVVRTKSSGDRVYLLDDNKKTRQWVTNGDVLVKLGFDWSDIVEVEDSELLKYNMGAALYRVE